MEYAACIISRVLLACVRVFLGAFASRARVLSRRGKYNDGERAELRAYVRTSRELALETGDKEGVSTAAIMIALSGSLTPVHRCTEPHVASAVHRCSGCTSRRVHMHRTALSARHPGTHARVHALYVSPAIHRGEQSSRRRETMSVFLALVVPPGTSPFFFFSFPLSLSLFLFIFIRTPFTSDYPRGSFPVSRGGYLFIYERIRPTNELGILDDEGIAISR